MKEERLIQQVLLKAVLLIFVTFLLVKVQSVAVRSQMVSEISGVVLDEDHRPIKGASVTLILFYNWTIEGSTLTDSEGKFQMTVNKEEKINVIVLADKPETPGFDFLPESTSVALPGN